MVLAQTFFTTAITVCETFLFYSFCWVNVVVLFVVLWGSCGLGVNFCGVLLFYVWGGVVLACVFCAHTMAFVNPVMEHWRE